VRPTTDRAREALFASLGATVEGVAVLDLYAGSGALAIEALSRGAAVAVLVEQHRAAAESCRQNLETTRLVSRGRVHATPVATFLRRGPVAEAPFGLVLCDPPYETPAAEVGTVLDLLIAQAWLAPDAAVVVERRAGGSRAGRGDAGRPDPRTCGWPDGWNVRWERRYGDTLLFALAAPRARPDANAGVGP
jgi:16S rRNA (guanine966-N2)-methyltransferase